ncbi:hypothetical protein [Paraburkholderia kirstenboschensis]|uniref:hypothetical protein n=1 Tax=Paraburkholderia kirstenboschensis TaxID=1245436 RepID=UPI000A93545E|nr:hypothetical protein [Paraburkholderia kirstenboschensis]
MDSKVSGTKKRNKTAGAYSGIPGDDMRKPVLKAGIRASGGLIGGQPLAAAMRARSRHVPERRDICENRSGVSGWPHSRVFVQLAAGRG